MKMIMTLTLGLSLLAGGATLSFAKDATTTAKKKKAKKTTEEKKFAPVTKTNL
jgi:hypothetical protein